MAKAAVVLDRAAFKTALRRVVNDSEFGKQLEAKPGTALRSIGLTLPNHVASELDRQPLSKTIEKTFGPPEGGPRPEILPLVIVEVAVGVVVEVAVRPDEPDPPGGDPGDGGAPPGGAPGDGGITTEIDEAIDKKIGASRVKIELKN
jgi:hypothetical protein